MVRLRERTIAIAKIRGNSANRWGKDAGHLRFVLGFQDHRIGLIQFRALKKLEGRRHVSDNFNAVASLEFFSQRIPVKYRIHS